MLTKLDKNVHSLAVYIACTAVGFMLSAAIIFLAYILSFDVRLEYEGHSVTRNRLTGNVTWCSHQNICVVREYKTPPPPKPKSVEELFREQYRKPNS